MGIIKDAANVTVTVTTAGMTAGYHLTTPRLVYAHLTKGFSVVNDTATMAPAWTGVASLTLDSAGIGSLDVGFVQIQECLGTSFDYVGPTPAAGSIRLAVSESPGMVKKLTLDSHDLENCRPFTLGQPDRWAIGGTTALTVNTNDHPALKVMKTMSNTTTEKTNYLRSITDKRKFWTMLAIKDGSSYTYLKHFTWSVTYEATFKWANGAIALDTSTSPGFAFGAVKNGMPSDQKLANLLAAPAAPMSNDVMAAAISAAANNGQTPNRKDHADGTCGGAITVPDDFFK
jgi:hypothetical protein